jgi:hypothetical protein
MADATSGAGTPEFIPVFSGVRVARGLVFCVVFCMSLFVLWTFSFGHCVVCPFSIYIFILITPLVSSNSSSQFTRIALFSKLVSQWCNLKCF